MHPIHPSHNAESISESVVESLISQLSKRVNAQKYSYTPAFKVDCNGRPYHAGTLTAVTFNGLHVLVTASHVLERDLRNSCDAENQIFVFSVQKIVN